MHVIVRDVPTMYSEMMLHMKMNGSIETSRNGTVLALPYPLTVTVQNPLHRTLVDPVRCANPFFHVAEVVWMISGSRAPSWISQFNARMEEYADKNNPDNVNVIHGAYGNRWRNYFFIDQLPKVVNLLKKDMFTRRAVLAMWDAPTDLATEHNDLPCNTHIYFRVADGKLDMTVCNRSNDVVWGMTGANAVHMTALQELIATSAGLPVGKYHVFTNNAHVYTELPNIDELLNTRYPHLPTDHNYGFYYPIPLLAENETLREFTEDCKNIVHGDFINVGCNWLKYTAVPMIRLYLNRKYGRDYDRGCETIEDRNWRTAAQVWLEVKNGSK